MTRSARILIVAFALVVATAAGAAQQASGYWKGNGNGSGSGLTATLNGGNGPSGSSVGQTVTVSFSQTAFLLSPLGSYAGGGYEVRRYTTTGTTPITPAAGTCASLVNGAAASLSCTETGVPVGQWRYNIRPILNSWTGAASSYTATVTVTPDAPATATATQLPAADMSVSWSAVPGVTGYNVYRRTTAGAYNFATPLNGGTLVSGTSFTDTTPVNGTSYRYVIRAVYMDGTTPVSSGNSPETAALVADGTNPTVTLTAIPASIGGDYTLTSTSSDAGSGIASIEYFYRTSSPAGAWTSACLEDTSPFDCDFDTTTLTDGLYDFRAIATDGAGNTTTTATQNNKRVDNTDPTATVNAVAPFVRGTITIGGTGTDTGGSGVASVVLQRRAVGAPTWATQCSGATSPLSCSFNTTTVADGEYELQLVVTDNAGNVTTSLVEDFEVDNTAPTVTMTDPGANLAGVELLESTAVDAGSGVASVQYQYKLSSSATWINACNSAVNPFSCNFNTAALADGFYDFRAIATDALGLQATSAAVTNRRIDNTTPTGVTITNPGSPLRGTITLNGAATDTGGGIANVAIQRSPAGTNTWTTICTDTTSPYSCSFNTTTVADGLYDFRAVATDNSNNSAASAPTTNRRIDNTAPAVTLTNPGSPVRATVNLAATATDAGSGMASVVFEYKLSTGTTWTTIATDTTSPYTAAFNAAALNGTYDIRARATDVAGNSGTSTVTVVIDNTRPNPAGIQTANGGGVLGRPDAGDTITYTYSEAMRATSFLAGWTGASTAVRVRITNGGSDRLTIRNSTGTTQLPFGTVRVTGSVTATAEFNATMVMSGNSIIVTLGSQISGTVATMGGNYTMRWTPSTTALDVAGNAANNTNFFETGAADREF